MINLSGFLKGSKVSWFALLVLLAVALSACGGVGGGAQPTVALPTAVGGGEARALPTAPSGEEVGTGASSGAVDTPEGTWGNYVRDMIAEQNQAQASKINLLERYSDPAINEKNLGGLVKMIELVADRTKFDLNDSETVASVKAEFDIRLSFANGDADTRTCKFIVELDKKDDLWYVLNPQPLAYAALCSK